MKRRQSQPAAQLVLWLFALWLVLVVISLFSRSYIPIDETRYVTVAWNMWLRGDYLVPWLNGVAYSHKPPLLFWLMNAGWAVFGVNDWWPRLVPSFFSLGSVFLTMRLARLLWPQEAQVAVLAPVLLLGSALWAVFTTATMFDMLIAFFALVGMLGILVAWQGNALKGWSFVGLAIGGGLLAKGPAILLQILPVAVLAPWWARSVQSDWKRWYMGLFAAVLLGVLIALAWAIPAGIRGGEVYHHAIFWGQTADRMLNSFAHKRALWWYLPLLPVMLFPWLLWPPVWRGLAQLRQGAGDDGVRFCLAWLVPVFLAFCLISGKQMHYLLPIFPAFALLSACGLCQASSSRFDQVPVALVALAVGALLIFPPATDVRWVANIPAWTGIATLCAGIALLLLRVQSMVSRISAMTLFSALVVVMAVYMGLISSAGLAYDVRPLGMRLKALQDAGVPLAHVGEYPGQYQFVGRLLAEPEVLEKNQVAPWLEAHPDGRLIVYVDDARLKLLKADYQQPYLNENVAIIGRAAWPLPKPHAP